MGESRYDRALTVFSPDGHLFQVEYAVEAVKKGITVLGVKGKDVVVLAVEKKTIQKLQELRTVRKIVQVDSHIMLGFAGLQADARVLVDNARVQCQSHRLQFDEPPKVEHIARFIARKQQKYTQSHGVRPYGVCVIICGRDLDGSTHVYQCDPSGMYSEWKACGTGRSGKTVQEYMEKHYSEIEGKSGGEGEGEADAEAEAGTSVDAEADVSVRLDVESGADIAVRTALKAMTEVVDSGRAVEVAILGANGMMILDDDTVDAIAKSVNKEKEKEKEEEKAKEKEGAGGGGDQ